MAVIPAGADLTSVTIAASSLPTLTGDYSGSYEFTFSTPISITSGGTYAIVVDTSGTSLAHPAKWGQHTSDNYAGGTRCYSFDDGSTWTSYSTRDNWFRTKASGVVKDSNDDAVSSVLDIPVITQDEDIAAQTFTASSSYTLTSVELKLWKDSTGISGNITVSIRNASELPTKPTNPTPANVATDVTLDQQTVTWENGGGATSYNVYYGTESGNLTLLESGVTDTSYTVFGITNGSPYDYAITRYWRIDAVNAAGTTTGDEWSFTTISFSTPAGGIRGGTPTANDAETNIKMRLVAFARNKVFYEDV